MASARLAFYKGKGNLVDSAIRWWTKSKYSHVELVCENEWISTSPRLMQVERRFLLPKEGNWEFVDVEVDPMWVEEFYSDTVGAQYDWSGIFFSQFLPLNQHSRTRWFCSEWCATAMKIPNANWYSPQDLYEYATRDK